MNSSLTRIAIIITTLLCMNIYSDAQTETGHMWIDEINLGGNFSQWTNDEFAYGFQFEIDKAVYDRKKWTFNTGLLLNFNFLPIRKFYNANGGSVEGRDLRFQLPQLILGAEYHFSEHFSMEPKLMGGMSYIYTKGYYSNNTIDLKSPEVKSTYAYFTTSVALDVNYLFTTKSGIGLSLFYPLSHRPTPRSVGIVYVRNLN